MSQNLICSSDFPNLYSFQALSDFPNLYCFHTSSNLDGVLAQLSHRIRDTDEQYKSYMTVWNSSFARLCILSFIKKIRYCKPNSFNSIWNRKADNGPQTAIPQFLKGYKIVFKSKCTNDISSISIKYTFIYILNV